MSDEEADAPPIPLRPPSALNDDSYSSGSRTWSSRQKPVEPSLNPPVSPFSNFPTLPPLLFTLPTLPTFAPFITPKPNNINNYSFMGNNNDTESIINSNSNSDNHFSSNFLDVSSKTTKNPFFLPPQSANDILQSGFPAPLSIFSSIPNRFRRSQMAAALKLSHDDESLDFVDDQTTSDRQKRSEYYDQVESEVTNEKATSNLNGDQENKLLMNDDEKLSTQNHRTILSNKLRYQKLNGYENCLRYLDQSDLRLF